MAALSPPVRTQGAALPEKRGLDLVEVSGDEQQTSARATRAWVERFIGFGSDQVKVLEELVDGGDLETDLAKCTLQLDELRDPLAESRIVGVNAACELGSLPSRRHAQISQAVEQLDESIGSLRAVRSWGQPRLKSAYRAGHRSPSRLRALRARPAIRDLRTR
jgi:hypothetical protein